MALTLTRVLPGGSNECVQSERAKVLPVRWLRGNPRRESRSGALAEEWDIWQVLGWPSRSPEESLEKRLMERRAEVLWASSESIWTEFRQPRATSLHRLRQERLQTGSFIYKPKRSANLGTQSKFQSPHSLRASVGIVKKKRSMILEMSLGDSESRQSYLELFSPWCICRISMNINGLLRMFLKGRRQASSLPSCPPAQ